MKESPRRYTNPFLSDEENEKLNLWTQELEHSNIEHDTLTNSLEPPEFGEKETELYTDKNVMECEFPDLLICYKEGAFHVKDICVDEGIPHAERFLFDENTNQMLNHEQLKFSTTEDYYMESNVLPGTDVKIHTGLPVLEPSNDNINVGDNHDEVTERKSDHMNIRVNCDEVTEKKSDAFSGIQEVDADLPLNEPINNHRDMENLRIDTEIPAQDLQDSVPDFKECGYKEEVSDSVGPNELKEISKDDISDGNGTSKSSADGFMVSSKSVTDSKATDNDAPDTSVQPDEKMNYSSEVLSDNVSTEKVVSNSGPTLEQDRSVNVLKATNNDGPDISEQPDEKMINLSDNLSDNVSTVQVFSNSGPSLEQARRLPSLKSLLESIDQPACQGPVEELSKRPEESGKTVEGNDTLNINNFKPATSSEDVHNINNLEHVDGLPIEPNGAPKLHDMGSDNVGTINQVHRGEGESSFSVAGPVPEHITYSGPIAFSGSTSLRSDSSTTSTRSFAFPILQNEWNSSPVRMAKADRRRLHKNRGWKHGLLCCRF